MLHDTIMNMDTLTRHVSGYPCNFNMDGTWRDMDILTNIPYRGINSLTNVYNRFDLLWSGYGAISPVAMYIETGRTVAHPECNRPYFFPEMNMYAWLERGNRRHITIEYEHKDTLTNVWHKEIFHGKRIYN